MALSQPAEGLFGFGIITARAADEYELCIAAPSGAERCRRHALPELDGSGVRLSIVVCVQDEGPGEYTGRWIIAGQPLGAPLPLTATRPRPTTIPPPGAESQCIDYP